MNPDDIKSIAESLQAIANTMFGLGIVIGLYAGVRIVNEFKKYL